MEVITMEQQTQDSAIPPAEQVSIPDDLLALSYMESVAERMKKRQRNVPAAATTIIAINKRQKIAREHDIKHTSGTTQQDESLKDAIQRSNSPATMLTPPRSDNGQLTLQDHETIDAAAIEHTVDPADVEFTCATLQALQQRLPSYNQCVGRRQTERIIQLLQVATPASPQEGPLLTEQEVIPFLAPGNYHDGPIFLKNQQPVSLVSVNELCAEFYDDGAGVWIQDPAAVDFTKSTREVSIGEVKERLRNDLPVEYPWNCLEMAAPFEDGLRPKFLNSEECRLLTKIKIPNPEPRYEGAKVGRRVLRHGYKEAEKWVLLAQSGALTEPHQDSHGYNTYITVNEGTMGYGWMHMPTESQRTKWIKSPHKFIDADWRYRILRPGDTVYFPAGTVHFVFRHPDMGHTLAFGGHVLRCSTIVPWIKAIRNESLNEAITNEELTVAAAGFLEQVGTFVKQALATSNPALMARWGGKESIETFLKLKSELVTMKEPKAKGRQKVKVARKPSLTT